MSRSLEDTESFNVAAVKCLLIGVLGSILLIVSYIVLELFWTGMITYNEGLKNIFLSQMALLIILIPVFTGALAAWSVVSQKMRFNGSAIAGFISGITGSFGFIVALSALILTMNISSRGLLSWNTVHGIVFPALTTGMLSFFSDVLIALMFALLSMMLSAIGGGIFFILSYYARKGALHMLALSGDARILTAIAVVLLAIIILPPAAAYAGEQSGLVASHGFVDPISVQRVSDDTILFTNNGGDALRGLDPASPIIVYVGIGGGYVKDITDQQAATKDGLNVTLQPSSGLGLASGSTLEVKGKSVVDLAYADEASGKKMIHVMVIGATTDGQKLVLLEKSV